MNEILEKLSGGDLRSEGRAEEVAQDIINNPRLLPALVEGLHSEEKLIRGRTCMTMEVISREHPDLLTDILPQLIELAATDTISQVRWHLAEVFGNLPVTADDAERIIPILIDYLGDKSKIVKYCAVMALAILGKESPRKEAIVGRIGPLKDEGKSMAKAVSKALGSLGEA